MSDDAMQRAANNAVIQVIARYCMILATVVGLPLCGYVGKRLLDTLDTISHKQDLAKDEINKIHLALSTVQGDNRMLGARIEDTARTTNSRLDALSAWTRKNTDEIDKIKDWFLKPTGISK